MKNLFNKLSYRVAASGWFDPSPEIRKVLEQEGWKFSPIDTSVHLAVYWAVPTGFVFEVKTPEGEPITHGYRQNYERYLEARRRAAGKVYGLG